MHGLLSPARALAAALLLLLVALVVVAAPARAAVVPSGFSEQVVFSGLTDPSNVAFAADGRVFVAEKSGLIKVFDSLDDPTPDCVRGPAHEGLQLLGPGSARPGAAPRLPRGSPRLRPLYATTA